MKQLIKKRGSAQPQYYLSIPKALIDSELLAVGQTMSIRSEKDENARNRLITSLMQDITDQCITVYLIGDKLATRDILEQEEIYTSKLRLIIELDLPFKIIKGCDFGQWHPVIDKSERGVVLDYVEMEGGYTFDTKFNRQDIEDKDTYLFDQPNNCYIYQSEEDYDQWRRNAQINCGNW